MKRHAFTLIEALVVMTIVSILLGLALTAIQKVRDTSNRSSCQANLKQLTLAMHQYHDTMKVLPPRQGANGGRGISSTYMVDGRNYFVAGNDKRYSTWVYLLPYIEQTALDSYLRSPQEFDVTTESGEVVTVPVAPNGPSPMCNNYKVWQTHIPILLCPGDAAGATGVNMKQSGYVVSTGDSFFGQTAAGANVRGLFGFESAIDFGSVQDGLSNTVCASERKRAKNATGRESELMAVMFQDDKNEVIPNKCRDAASPRGWKDDAPGWAGKLSGSAGIRWGDGAFPYNAFNSVLPPNAPMCSYSGDGAIGVYPPSSKHQGGVNVSFMDGSVKFVSDNIDAGDASVGVSRTVWGPSPFGVWGAMSTRRGGESLVE